MKTKQKQRSTFKLNLLVGATLAAGTLAAQATEVAPYFYTWAFGSSGYAVNSLAQAKTAGVNAVTLAFGTSDGSCNLQGFNFSASTKQDVQSYLAGGGRIILSFGGADGPFLEDTCSTSGLYNIINNLISTYKIYALDFDVEGGPVDDTASANTRNAVIKQLQAAYPNLYVSFTVPVGSGGLPGDVVTLIKNAKNAGVKINVVNIMTMDYGADTGGQAEGKVAVESANNTFNQLKSIYTGSTAAQIWSMIGITPMIGLNDGSTTKKPTEQFTPTDATTVTQFAETNGLGLLAFWAINRDQPGTVNSENDLDKFDNTGTSKLQFYNIMKAAQTDGAGAGSPPPPPVVNGSFPAGTYTVMNAFSGKCLDDTDWGTADRTPMQQWSCSGTTNQTFRFYPIGSTTPVSVK